MTIKLFILVLIAEVCSACMHVLFKRGVNTLDTASGGVMAYLRFIKNVLATPAVWCGLAVVACGMGFWLLVLAHAELSLAFPLDSIQYIIILIASYLFLGERINRDRVLGTLFIIAGIVLVALN